MSLKKDKQKVLGEVFDVERIQTFFDYQPSEGENADFHLLLKAYRGMKAENFATFVELFQQQGRDVNAESAEGKTLLQIVTAHRNGEDYADVLKQAGAQ